MSDVAASSIASLISKRANALPGNPFAEADASVAAAIAAGEDVIDLSKGNPDGEPPEFMKDALAKAAYEQADYRYAPFDGKPNFLAAAADWYRRQHGVELDASTQLLATAGSSVGISVVIEALIDEGDTVLAVDPFYPQYEGSTAVAKGRFVTIPTDAAHGFLPDLNAVDPALLDRAKLLILNYPNNPTGAAATPELYADAVRLAKRHHFVVMNDFAYAGLGFDEQPAVSLLTTPGALDVAVELCSLSKMYMVAGWRGGFIAGNAEVLAGCKAVHRQTTVLASSVIQDAGAAALASDQSSVPSLAARYKRRCDVLHEGLVAAGYTVFPSHGGLFAWMKVPDGHGSSDDYADFLLHTAGVAVMPGSCFGASGEGYVRLSLLRPEGDLAKAVRRLAAVA